MKEVVQRLNKVPGVRGSALVARDGMPIVSDLAEGMTEDVAGAMISAIGTTTSKALEKLAQGQLFQMMMDASGGKLFLCETRVGYLAVFTDADVNVGLIKLELREGAAALNQSRS